MIKTFFKNNNRGAIALTSTIILSVVISLVGVSFVFLNLSSRLSIFNLLESESTFVMAEGCLEEGLIRIKRDPNYKGGTYTVDSATCVLSLDGEWSERTLSLSASTDDFTHDFTVELQISPSFAIMNWTE